MPRSAAGLSSRLARDAEAVCRHYLSNGRRQGQYWLVGDVRNAPGGSMFVRLKGPDTGPGAAGRWTDAASAEHGDLLDVIRESCGLIAFRDVALRAEMFAHHHISRERLSVRQRMSEVLGTMRSQAFVEFVGADAWNDPAAEWIDRGIERAASAIARSTVPRLQSAPWRCCARCASPPRNSGFTSTRTSSRAACASAR